MAAEGRRRKSLTPLESELQPPADWTPPGPVAEQYKPKVKAEKRAPTTTRGMLLHGLKRFMLFSAAVVGGVAALALLIIVLADTSPERTFMLSFMIAGAVLGIGGVLGSTGSEAHWYYDVEERQSAFDYSFVYVAFGALLFGLGVLFEILL